MLINIPVTFYSLIAFWAARYQQHGPDGVCTLFQSHPILMALCCYLPIVTTILAVLSDLPRQWKLSKLYDSDGKEIRNNRASSFLPPFLPDKESSSSSSSSSSSRSSSSRCKEKYDSVYQHLIKKQQELPPPPPPTSANASWALVTGASKGIGRAIAISLARRNIPIVLVARNLESLQSLSKLIQECYGVETIAIQCDITNETDIDSKLMKRLEQHKPQIKIDILINNAGLGESCDFVDNVSNDNTEQMIHVNVIGTTKLTQKFGSAMKNRHRHHPTGTTHSGGGRIVVISSIMGAVPGIGTSAIYAATKSYQRSFCCSLGRELESHGIGVTCVMPGAVDDTGFREVANMADSTVFHLPLPGLALTPEHVAETTVKAMIAGRHEVFVGWMYVLKGQILCHLLPERLTALIAEFVTKPMSAWWPGTSFSRRDRETRQHTKQG